MEPFYLLHFTYGMDYTRKGVFTPGALCMPASRSMCDHMQDSNAGAVVPRHLRINNFTVLTRMSGKYGEWRFDKRTYAQLPPPRHLSEPPRGMKNALVGSLAASRSDAYQYMCNTGSDV